MDTFWQDVKYGARQLARNPGFTAVAVLTLALGIGANTAIFSVVNAVLLRPLPFENPNDLVYVQETARRETVEPRPLSYPDFLDWKEQTTCFSDLVALATTSFTLSGDGGAERIVGEDVSSGYFSLLGAKPQVGRAFLSGEDRTPQGEPVAILSHSLWQRRFNADRAVIGRSITLDGTSYGVVGVAAPGFRGLSENTDVWIPFTSDPRYARYLAQRGARWHEAIGRLRPGLSLSEAQAEMDALAMRLEQDYPGTNEARGVRIRSLVEVLFGSFRLPLLVLLAAVGFVLLIACLNVTTLVLTRALSRRNELALRTVLGANRWRIARQLLAESALLVGLGGTLGVIAAAWAVDVVGALSLDLPSLIRVSLDGPVLAFTLVLMVAATLLAGLSPTLQLWEGNLQQSLQAGGRDPGAVLGQSRLRSGFVVTQIALALILLIGAGLLLRSFLRLRAVDPGFVAEGVLTGALYVPQARTPNNQAKLFAQELLQRVEAVPQVEAAALATDVPLGDDSHALFLTVEGRSLKDRAARVRVYEHGVTPDFFQTLRIPLVRGRPFSPEDTEGALRVVIVSQSAAERIWPGEEPLGERIMRGSYSPENPWWVVVGVVGDVRYRRLVPEQEEDPDVYFPFEQWPASLYNILVRSSSDPAALTPTLRQLVQELNPDVPLYRAQALPEMVANRTASDRMTAFLLGAFALASLLLAIIGVYGVISYSVGRRSREFGIRLALGAQPQDIRRLVVHQGMILTLLGIGIGLAGALGLTRFLSSLLFEVPPRDLATFAGVSLLTVAVAFLACWLPARRATRVDPMVALRYE